MVGANTNYTATAQQLAFAVSGGGHIFEANFTTFNGQTAAQYWGNATTAEWINERPTYNGVVTDLREPAINTTLWGPGLIGGSVSYPGKPTQTNISSLSPDSIYLVNGGHNLATVPVPFPKSDTWKDTWHACE